MELTLEMKLLRERVSQLCCALQELFRVLGLKGLGF